MVQSAWLNRNNDLEFKTIHEATNTKFSQLARAGVVLKTLNEHIKYLRLLNGLFLSFEHGPCVIILFIQQKLVPILQSSQKARNCCHLSYITALFIVVERSITNTYYMTSSVSGQDEPNRAL